MLCVNVSDASLADFEGPLLSFRYIYMACHPLGFALLIVWLLMLSEFLKSTADEFLSPVMAIICDLLSLDAQVAGATLLAFGNGAPDVFAALAAFTNSKSNADLGLGSLLGGASFVTTMVLGAVLLVCEEPIKVELETFGRDAFFLLVAISWLAMLSRSPKGATVGTSAIFLVIYGIYVGLIVWQSRSPKRPFGRFDEEEDPLLAPDPTVTSDVNDLASLVVLEHFSAAKPREVDAVVPSLPASALPSRRRPLLDSILNDVYWRSLRSKTSVAELAEKEMLRLRELFIVWRVLRMIQTPLGVLRALTIPIPDDEAWSKSLVVMHPPLCTLLLLHVFVGLSNAGLVLVCLVTSLLVSAVAFVSFQDARPPSGWCKRLLLACVSFGMCVVWIYMVAGEFVALLDSMGVVVGANRSLLGLSLLAWGNSVGDLFNNVAVARAGYPTMVRAAFFVAVEGGG